MGQERGTGGKLKQRIAFNLYTRHSSPRVMTDSDRMWQKLKLEEISRFEYFAFCHLINSIWESKNGGCQIKAAETDIWKHDC